MPSTWSEPTAIEAPSRPGVRSLTTHHSVSVVGVGPYVDQSPGLVRRRASSPVAASGSTSPGRARSASSRSTGDCSSHSRTRVSRRRTAQPWRAAPGSVSLRDSAACADGTEQGRDPRVGVAAAPQGVPEPLDARRAGGSARESHRGSPTAASLRRPAVAAPQARVSPRGLLRPPRRWRRGDAWRCRPPPR